MLALAARLLAAGFKTGTGVARKAARALRHQPLFPPPEAPYVSGLDAATAQDILHALQLEVGSAISTFACNARLFEYQEVEL